MEATRNNSYLATAPIGKLILKFSVPCIMSLLIAALYNLVDQIFIGWGIGYLGNGATNVIYPITVITLALAVLIGDGCAAYLSLCQGKGDMAGAHKSVGNGVVLSVSAGVILMVLFMLLKEQILWGFGATEKNIGYAYEYFRYIVLGIPFYMFGNAMNGIIRADGSPKFAMASTLVGCIMNIILDPVAIFVLGWGMAGAALATISGQIVTALLAAYYLFHTKSFTLNRTSFRLDAGILKKVLPLGGTSFLTQISIVIIMAVMNNVLVTYGAMSKYGEDIPLTVVGIVMKVFAIVVSVAVGITIGAQPIIGYNYGAGNKSRVKDVFRKVMMAEFCVGVIATICFECFPLQIIGIFGSGDALYQEFACLSFRIFLGTVLLCVMQKSISIFLQALGKSVLSTMLSLLREIVLSVPLILFLPVLFGVVGPLFAGPVADVVSFVAAVFMVRYTMKQLSTEESGKRTIIFPEGEKKI